MAPARLGSWSKQLDDQMTGASVSFSAPTSPLVDRYSQRLLGRRLKLFPVSDAHLFCSFWCPLFWFRRVLGGTGIQ